MSTMKLVQTLEGIGTHWFFFVEESAAAQYHQIHGKIAETIEEFNQLYSRFLPNSLVSQINRGEKISNIPDDLAIMLSVGYQLQEITNRIYTLGIGSTLNHIGYNQNYRFTKSAESEIQLNPFITFEHQELQLYNGAQLDLGSLGKGFLIDKIGNLLELHGIEHFLINGGGDILLKSENPEKIILQHPLKPGYSFGYCESKDTAFAASAPSFRSWVDPTTQAKLHHLVSPHSSIPITEIAAVFVQAKSAFLADALATVFFVSPSEFHAAIQATFPCEYALFFPDESFWQSPGFIATIE